jgi:hypothetical protein
MPLIDRLVAPFGARSLVAGRPRMGWLLTEIAPAMLWTSLTGALTLDGYNLVLYLTLLGASAAQLAWLPVANYAGIALHVLASPTRSPGAVPGWARCCGRCSRGGWGWATAGCWAACSPRS